MKQKIVQLMKSEGLSSSRLAEILEIQPSGVSHLVSGRNKPSFELLQKILRRFPNINPYWLILEDENMYRQDSSISFTDDIIESTPQPLDPFATADLFASITQEPQQKNMANDDLSDSSKIDKKHLQISQVLLLYSDGTCRALKCRE